MIKKKSYTWIYILAIVILIGFVYAYNPFINEKVNNFFKEIKIDSASSSVAIREDDSCPEGIIPDELKVWTQYSGEYHDDGYLGSQMITSGLKEETSGVFTKEPLWKDGVIMGVTDEFFGESFDSICRVGSETGENINFFYCEGLTYSKTTQKLKDDGKILGYEQVAYTINLTLDREPYNKEELFRTTLTNTQVSAGYFFYYNVVGYSCELTE